MKALRKMSFDALVENISVEDMKLIIAGSGSSPSWGPYNQPYYTGGSGSGNMGYYASDRGMSSQFTPAGTLLFTPNGDYSNPSISSNQNTYGYGTTNYGGSYGSGSYGGGNSSNSIANGTNWVTTGNGIRTTNPLEIGRILKFMENNNSVSNEPMFWNKLTNFLNNEQTYGGRINNDALYGTFGAEPLNNVTVVNKFKTAGILPPGITYETNGGLSILGLMMGSGGYGTNGQSGFTSLIQSGTKAILVPFTKEEIVNGFSKIDFAGMSLESIPDWDPVKKEHNYMNSFQPNMKINVDGAIAIALYEQLSLTVYDSDGSDKGNATIGFGHKLHAGLITASDIKMITFDQAISYLTSDIIKTENMLNRKIENLDLTGKFSRNQYFALFDMAYNSGGNSDSILTTVLNSMKSGGVSAANKAIENAYYNADPERGIMDRRYFEAQAFVNDRILTPEQARAELKNLGLKK
ncbi:glycoside hydrolase family protein [Flavobacterium collinsii]|uniref:Lysozyme n=1 Tax=Flavobacterium collinsii TaxID=1114861 RepID=A0ABM8KKV9_9FLAO|nr:hypothetical protein [Flavobacterium collinsii]CAA9199992.1 hypothetical protein FLACOL7796_02991 [Flavobacterium collinsii]